MSRSGYSDDYDDQWGLIRWRGAVASAMKGARGQAFLKEMVEALDALPQRQLIADDLVKLSPDIEGKALEYPQVCAIGAVGLKRGVDMSELDPEDYRGVANAFGIASAMAQEIVYVNDEMFYDYSPEKRWLHVRRWLLIEIKDWHNPESDLMLGESG